MSFLISNQPYDVITSIGQTATFSYLVSDPTGTITYQWLTDNHRIALLSGYNPLPGAEFDGLWPIVGAIQLTYVTPTLISADNGSQFICEVTDVIITQRNVATQQFTTTLFQNYSSRCAVLQVH
jgi:hypothetical protein